MKSKKQKEVSEVVRKKNIVYEKPAIEVIEMEMEGILCASGQGSGEDFGNGGGGVW